MEMAAAIKELHDRCAIYTTATTASRLLDMVGWTAEADLSKCVLLEPCVGEGAILLEGARRLIASMLNNRRSLSKAALLPRIKGFEFHPEAARLARINLCLQLLDSGIRSATARALSEGWIRERDFLLEPPQRATHIAANPPYVRWGKLPLMLAKKYRDVLPTAATRGDLSVAFLHRMQEWAREGGAISALVSDRWMYAQYGEEFVKDTKAQGWSIDVADERPSNPFVREVGAYSAIVLLTRGRALERAEITTSRTTARSLHGKLVARHGTLAHAGCRIRVGPALGAGKTFIFDADQPIDVEDELVRPFVSKQDLTNSEVTAPRRRVVVPYDRAGTLIDLIHWPRFARWAASHEDILTRRSQFRDSKQYWRTIDAVPSQWAISPKLLLPELCNKPVTTIDRTGSIPAHSIYAIWSEEWPIEVLQRVLNAGLLELTSKAEAPTLKSGWMRFYKRFLMRTPLPKWVNLSSRDQVGLGAAGDKFERAFERLFGFRPGALSGP